MSGKKIGEETVNLILGVAAIFILIYLLFALFWSTYDKDEKTADAYLDRLRGELDKAEKEGVGSFNIWEPRGDEAFFALVYFGDGTVVEGGKSLVVFGEEVEYVSVGQNKNHVCICYSEGVERPRCTACDNLDLPLRFSDGGGVIGPTSFVYVIKKVGDVYEFKR